MRRHCTRYVYQNSAILALAFARVTHGMRLADSKSLWWNYEKIQARPHKTIVRGHDREMVITGRNSFKSKLAGQRGFPD